MPLKVLIIDNNTDESTLVNSTLGAEGYDVASANNFEDGLAILKNGGVDLLLLANAATLPENAAGWHQAVSALDAVPVMLLGEGKVEIPVVGTVALPIDTNRLVAQVRAQVGPSKPTGFLSWLPDELKENSLELAQMERLLGWPGTSTQVGEVPSKHTDPVHLGIFTEVELAGAVLHDDPVETVSQTPHPAQDDTQHSPSWQSDPGCRNPEGSVTQSEAVALNASGGNVAEPIGPTSDKSAVAPEAKAVVLTDDTAEEAVVGSPDTTDEIVLESETDAIELTDAVVDTPLEGDADDITVIELGPYALDLTKNADEVPVEDDNSVEIPVENHVADDTVTEPEPHALDLDAPETALEDNDSTDEVTAEPVTDSIDLTDDTVETPIENHAAGDTVTEPEPDALDLAADETAVEDTDSVDEIAAEPVIDSIDLTDGSIEVPVEDHAATVTKPAPDTLDLTDDAVVDAAPDTQEETIEAQPPETVEQVESAAEPNPHTLTSPPGDTDNIAVEATEKIDEMADMLESLQGFLDADIEALAEQVAQPISSTTQSPSPPAPAEPADFNLGPAQPVQPAPVAATELAKAVDLAGLPMERVEEIVAQVAREVIQEVVWESVPAMVAKMLAGQGDDQRFQNLLEKAVWETIPPIAETKVQQEIQRLADTD